ncbi:MAG: hypothetical protein HYT09_03810 [Candidatus Levybacteria bacterium]|nr:hypothetical protein [Candidatus Levybacteria bacterium]
MVRKAKTGNNEASNNTGGNVTIDTGNATSNVDVNITGGGNTANVSCACNTTNDTVNVIGNAANTTNTANVTNTKLKKGTQTNGGSVKVKKLKSRAKTGKNKANNNTNGTVDVLTGNATSNVDVNVTTPSNTLNITP